MEPAHIAKRIRVLREQLVLLDVDLADLYGVSPERLREAVRQHRMAISVEFVFPIEPNEMRHLKPQPPATYPYADRSLPLAFTEHGVIMAARALDRPDAVQTSIQVVRAFVKRREETSSNSNSGGRTDVFVRPDRMLH